MGAQGLIQWQGITEQASLLTSTTLPPGNSSPSVTRFVAVPGDTTLLVLDTSILTAQDNDTGFYLAVASDDVSWRGATVVRSVDGVSDWQPVATFQARARYGVTATVLGDWPGYNTWDRASTVDITMAYGTPDSSTEDAILAGLAHPYLIGDEIVYAATATFLSGTTWRLSVFLRGRRGTEWAMGAHTTDEQAIVLESDTVQRYSAPTTDVYHTRYYKTLSTGQGIDDVTATTVVNRAHGQDCFAPGHVRGTRNASNDVTATWRPRTRIPWTRIAGVAGPLGEREERYTVSSILGLGSPIVLRTWTVTTRTVTYLASEQTADGLTPGDPVYLKVQMLNDYTGAGHAAEAAL